MGEFLLIRCCNGCTKPFVSIEEVISRLGFQVGEQTSPPKGSVSAFLCSPIPISSPGIFEGNRPSTFQPGRTGDLREVGQGERRSIGPGTSVDGCRLGSPPAPPADPLWDIKVSLVFA